MTIQQICTEHFGSTKPKSKKIVDEFLTHIKTRGLACLSSTEINWLVGQLIEEHRTDVRGGFGLIVMRRAEKYASGSDDRLLVHFETLLRSTSSLNAAAQAEDYAEYINMLMWHEGAQNTENGMPSPLLVKLFTMTIRSKRAHLAVSGIQMFMMSVDARFILPVNSLEEIMAIEESERQYHWIWPPELQPKGVIEWEIGIGSDSQSLIRWGSCDHPAEVEAFVQLLAEKREAMTYGLLQIWDDITSAPNYDIRAGQADCFTVTGVLANGREQVRHFKREGATFPSALVTTREVWQYGDFPSRSIIEPNNVYWWDKNIERLQREEYPQGLSDALLMLADHFINSFAYHCIVRKERAEQLERKEIAGARSTTARSERQHWVRPHFRRLPEGYKPSDEKLEEALERLGHLPPGMTFVTDHERHTSEGGVRSAGSKGDPKPFLRLDPELLIASLQ